MKRLDKPVSSTISFVCEKNLNVQNSKHLTVSQVPEGNVGQVRVCESLAAVNEILLRT